VHLPTDIEEPVGALEAALAATLAAEPVEAKLKDARARGASIRRTSPRAMWTRSGAWPCTPA
jgi:hypothetical protein